MIKIHFLLQRPVYSKKKALQTEGELIEARLSDVRRRACCLSSFHDLQIGKEYQLMLVDNLNFMIGFSNKFY